MENLPRYVAEPLLRFLDYLEESMRLLHTSMQGMGMITTIPNALTVLGERAYSEEMPDDPKQRKQDFQRHLESAQKSAAFAEKERTQGFPLLHAHTLVGFWSALESAIEDAIVGMLVNEPDLLQNEVFSRVRIPLAEYELLEKEERMRFLVEEVERSHIPARRRGVDGFEGLLGVVGLTGPVDADLKKTLWELSHLRNVIVHRGSVADRQLVQKCPWLGLKVGDKVTVSHGALGRYYSALYDYLMTLIYRLGAKYGVDIEKKIQS